MFDDVRVRFFSRVLLAAGLAGLAALKASIGDGLTGEEIVNLVEVTLGAGAAYAGIGVVTPIEPHVSTKGFTWNGK